MQIREFIGLTQTPEDAYNYAKSKGLVLSIPPLCPAPCNRRMFKERGKIRQGINGRFRCPDRTCRASLPLLHGSVFEGSHLELNVIFDLLYAHAERKTTQQSADFSGVGDKAVRRWNKILKDKILEYIYPLTAIAPFSFRNYTYEVDECHIYSHKNNQGRILAGMRFWVVGIFCRETKQIRLFVTRRRNKLTLHSLILSQVPYGARVFTDGWRGYLGLTERGFDHDFVNHSVNFVNPVNREVHTQNIERTWRSLREFLPGTLRIDDLENWVYELSIVLIMGFGALMIG